MFSRLTSKTIDDLIDDQVNCLCFSSNKVFFPMCNYFSRSTNDYIDVLFIQTKRNENHDKYVYTNQEERFPNMSNIARSKNKHMLYKCKQKKMLDFNIYRQ